MSLNTKRRQSFYQALNVNTSNNNEEPQKDLLDERDQILVDFKETYFAYNLNELSKSKAPPHKKYITILRLHSDLKENFYIKCLPSSIKNIEFLIECQGRIVKFISLFFILKKNIRKKSQ